MKMILGAVMLCLTVGALSSCTTDGNGGANASYQEHHRNKYVPH
ncbi:hypothetical protein [Rhizobium paknamense]|uniref:Tetrahydromethanopterin S-methyltransferase subunit E n=1 Tax=Rhizobium paknamense TaxID=1206817 RepID=A0ABU0ILG9_9HYPH|nr:hypothetical protein [Rhizobium paknamense]MDQ0458453.1 tetrahydromethanopterin S-methyltransferase subunit E [Rhizobium paknamense]